MVTDSRSRLRRLTRWLLLGGAAGCALLAAGCAQNSAARRTPFPALSQYEGRPVGRVAFAGNPVLPLDSLRAVTTVRPPQCRVRFLPRKLCFLGVRQQRLDLGSLAGDVVRLQLYLRDHGYYGSRVVPDVETIGEEEVEVRFIVAPGDQVILRTLEVQGTEEVVPAEEVEARLPLREGEPFSRIGFLSSADSVRSLLWRRGHAYANVLRNYGIDTIADVAEASFLAVPGPVVRVDSILVIGSDRLDRRTIEKQVTVRSGQVLQLPELANSQRNLYQLSIVNFASVELAPDSLQVDPDSSTATVAVRIVEAAKYLADAAAGFGTVDCGRVQGRLLDRNFFGGARTLELSASASRIGSGAPLDFGLRSQNFCGGGSRQVPDTVLAYRVAADFLQPRLLGTRTQLGLNVHAERQSEISLFVRRSVGSQLSLSRGIGRGALLGLGLNVARSSTTASDAIFCVIFTACTEAAQRPLEQSRWANAATASASLDRTQGTGLTRNGYLLRGSVAWASPLLLSDDRYLSLFGDAAWYRAVRRNWELAMRLQGGVFASRAVGSVTGYIPPERRFYAGGPNSVRGFPPNALGPQAYVTDEIPARADLSDVDPQRYPLGGTRMVVGSVELRGPSSFLPQYLRWAGFVDVGQVWAPGLRNPDTDVQFDNASLYVTPGAGLRITTPVGPIRLDVGYNPYGLRTGPLYLAEVEDERPTGSLELFAPNFRPRQSGLLDRLQIHLAVGQAF